MICQEPCTQNWNAFNNSLQYRLTEKDYGSGQNVTRMEMLGHTMHELLFCLEPFYKVPFTEGTPKVRVLGELKNHQILKSDMVNNHRCIYPNMHFIHVQPLTPTALHTLE